MKCGMWDQVQQLKLVPQASLLEKLTMEMDREIEQTNWLKQVQHGYMGAPLFSHLFLQIRIHEKPTKMLIMLMLLTCPSKNWAVRGQAIIATAVHVTKRKHQGKKVTKITKTKTGAEKKMFLLQTMIISVGPSRNWNRETKRYTAKRITKKVEVENVMDPYFTAAVITIHLSEIMNSVSPCRNHPGALTVHHRRKTTLQMVKRQRCQFHRQTWLIWCTYQKTSIHENNKRVPSSHQ